MSKFSIASIVERYIVEFDLNAVRDILLEFLAVIGFIFLLIVIIIALVKAPILTGHGSIEMFIFVILGIIHSIMNFVDECIYFTANAYNVWKIIKDATLLTGAVLLLIGFFRFFIFSARLFGIEQVSKHDSTTNFD